MASPYTPDEAVQGSLYQPDQFDLSLTSLRVHALAITRWLNQAFYLAAGVPVPVIWATPMNAFSQFDELWNQNPSPYDYLKSWSANTANPQQGAVFPNPQRFPLINLDFKSFTYAPDRSYGGKVFRTLGWQAVDTLQTPGFTLSDLGNVQQARMPLAMDLNYQVDHWCLRPDTQAFFVEQLLETFKVSQATLQRYIPVLYPSYFGTWLVKMRLDPTISDGTEKDPVDNVVKYRTTFNLTLEGWRADQKIRVTPALWSISLNLNAVEPNQIEELYALNGLDLRAYQQNPVLALRTNLPPGTVVGSIVTGSVF